jgi:hypothetical protein
MPSDIMVVEELEIQKTEKREFKAFHMGRDLLHLRL